MTNRWTPPETVPLWRLIQDYGTAEWKLGRSTTEGDENQQGARKHERDTASEALANRLRALLGEGWETK